MRPHMNSLSRSTAHSPTPTPPVVDYLCEAGERYAQHKLLLRRQQALRERRLNTGRPVITSYDSDNMECSSSATEPVGERLYILHERKLKHFQSLRAQQEAAEMEELTAQCHGPTLTRKAAQLQRKDVYAINQQWLHQRDVNQQRLKAKTICDELREVRANPHITTYAHAQAMKRRPHGMAIEDWLLTQRKCQSPLSVVHDAGALADTEGRQGSCVVTRAVDNCQSRASRSARGWGGVMCHGYRSTTTTNEKRSLFTPHLTRHARRLHRQGSVISRLYPQPVSSKIIHSECALQTASAPCIGGPLTTSIKDTSDWSEQNGDATNGCRFTHEHLYRRPCTALPLCCEMEDCHANRIMSLKPDVCASLMHKNGRSQSKASQHSARHGSGRQSQVPGYPNTEKMSRLENSLSAKAAAHSRCAVEGPSTSNEEGEEKHSCDMAFRPRLCITSRRLYQRQLSVLRREGRVMSNSEARLWRWQRETRRLEEEREATRALLAEQEMRECTFVPQIHKPRQQSVTYKGNVVARNVVWARCRSERLERVRAENAKREVEGCTFQPLIQDVFPLPRTSVASAEGVSAFVQRQREARRQRRESERWWLPPGRHRAASADTKETHSVTSYGDCHTVDDYVDNEGEMGDGLHIKRGSSPMPRSASCMLDDEW